MESDTRVEDRISIVIPTYNRADVLSSAIKSVIQQSYNDWELIIVDDGSEDETDSMIEPYIRKYDKIKYYRISNSGAAFARNFGVRKSTGRTVTFLDSDDRVKMEWLERMYSRMREERAAVVSCGVEKISVSGHKKSVYPNRSPLSYGLEAKFTNGGSFMIDRDIFLAVGGYDPELRAGQHTELGFRVARHIAANDLRVAAIRDTLVEVTDHLGPRIRNDHEAVFEGTAYLLEKHGTRLGDLSPRLYYKYLSVAGVRGVAAGYAREGRKYLLEAWKVRPYSPKSMLRLLLSCFPRIAQGYWARRLESSRHGDQS